MANRLDSRLAVCSWSLRAGDPRELMAQLESIGIRRVQIALDPLRESPAVWGGLAELFGSNGVELISGMFGAAGEDYSTLESIRRTGGVVPDATWPENWRNIQTAANLAQKLGLKLVTFHAGFLPHEPGDPGFQTLLQRLGLIADLFAERGLELGLETGQETAETLGVFLHKLGRTNVGVNFDPANMILYDKGDPIAALRALGPWLKQCHIKDAVRTRTPGTWGAEVPVGAGEVDWRAFLRTLDELRFQGNLVIEREAGEQRAADIRAARERLEEIKN
ncbi:MAG: sugar phosphate isomerase/epimerase family protein [Verrucomicrobiota bacterium]